jgi:hypothetical protein
MVLVRIPFTYPTLRAAPVSGFKSSAAWCLGADMIFAGGASTAFLTVDGT